MARHDDRKHVQFDLSASGDSGSRWPLLEAGLVTKTTKEYKKAVNKFLQWSDDRCLKTDDDDYEKLDEHVADYIQFHYDFHDGRGRQHCVNVVYGIIMILPRADDKLIVSKRMINRWKKEVPSESYPPLTWDLAVTIAVQMVRSGHYRFAVATVLGFDCLLRINELLSLRANDFADAKDARMGSEYKLTSFRIRTAKTGKNQSVDVLDESVKTLVRPLVAAAKRPDDLLFPGGDRKYRALFHQCCAELQLSRDYVPHSLRHGGATRLFLQGWALDDIMIRGRWAATASARRYIQSAKAVAIATAVPDHIQSIASALVSDVCQSFAYAQKH